MTLIYSNSLNTHSALTSALPLLSKNISKNKPDVIRSPSLFFFFGSICANLELVFLI